MSMPMKCPNPNCPFVFDASLVPPGILIGCPQCHMQFTMPAMAPGYAPHPAAAASAPEVNEDLDFSAPAATATKTKKSRPKAENEGDSDPRAKPRKKGEQPEQDEAEEAPPKKSMLPLLILLGGIFGTLLFAGAMIVLVLSFRNRGVQGVSGDLTYQSYHLGFSPPKDLEGWSRDTTEASAMSRVGANLIGFKKTETGMHMAFHARGNFGYTPQDPELEGITHDMLSHAFDAIKDTLDGNEDNWLGVKGKRYTFTGVYKDKPNGETVAGEVYVVATKGIAYWAFAWGPEANVNSHAEEFTKLRNSWKFLQSASGVAEPKPKAREYGGKGKNSKAFAVTDYEDLWLLPPNVKPTTKDEKADLYLRNNPKGGDPTRLPDAEFIVAILDGGGDVKMAAEEHIKNQLPRGESPPKFDELTGDPTGESPKVAGVTATSEVTRWEVRFPGADKSSFKLVVFSAMESNGKIVVAYAMCELAKKSRWEQHMMLLAGSLRKPK